MQIFVKTVTGRTITVKVDPGDSVYVVKAKIQDQQRLMFGTEELEDGLTLAHYDIEDECTLHLVFLLNGGAMQIFIKTLGGKTITVKVDPEDTVYVVKAKI
ncbi:polyubiquitin-like [Triticum aestivum]|uniref:polyubiquitin-like n=1 Tax=Triticum aestivum TaxID=4565 RepID=UPI001D026536|nr:polyubiquitin-like [Triticum aestivum]